MLKNILVSTLVGLATFFALVLILASLGGVGSGETILIVVASCGGAYFVYRRLTKAGSGSSMG